ncbi:MFS transporter [Haladaptatus halobius]|uniref:MFS transporter n=1 Tax=Haladaptatus halobius TaxID=2884875 RepID=UPI001D0B4486|nr:MFS transporter [Haladaptatus halobius]
MKPRWHALGVMFVIQCVGSLTFLSLTVLTPFIKSDFGVSTSDIGFLVTALYLGYFLSLTPGGILTDFAGERFTLALGMTTVGLVAVTLSIFPMYWMLCSGVFLLGLGYGTIPSGTNKGIFDWFPSEQRTIGISIKQTGVMFGGAIGAAFLPALAELTGWRSVWGIVSSLAFATLGVLYVYSPGEQPSGRWLPPHDRIVGKFKRMHGLASEPGVLPLLVSGVLFGMSQFTIMAYIVLYLTENLFLAPAVAGVLYTGMQLAGIVSRIGLGFLTDSLFAENKQLVLAGLGIVGFVFFLPMALFTANTGLPIVVGVLVVVGAVSLGYNGVYLTIAGELAGDEDAGVATGMGVAAVMAGAVLFPPVFGFIVEATGSYSLPLGAIGLITLGAGVSAVRVGRSVPR